MNSETLDRTVAWRELADWYMHWMVCTLDETKRKIDLAKTEEELAHCRDEIIRINQRFRRMLWEFVTIWGNDDSESELKSLLKKTPKGIKLVKAKEETIGCLRERWEQMSNVKQGHFMMELIANDWQ